VIPPSNFAFLSYFGASLFEAAARAELVIALDPVGALNHLRLLGESLARAACVRLGLGEMRALAEAKEALELQRARYEAELASLQTKVQAQSAAEQQTQLERTIQAAAKVNLDEASTRAIIDEQLRAAGWEANTQELRFARGTRPEKGKTLAIAEWPTSEGPADYVLFDGLTAMAVVEAKKIRKDVVAALEQAKRYASALMRDARGTSRPL
jgi:type I restriction enzyme R subunit